MEVLIKTIDEEYKEIQKSKVKGFVRTKKGKMERVNPFERAYNKAKGLESTYVTDDKGWHHLVYDVGKTKATLHMLGTNKVTKISHDKLLNMAKEPVND